MAATRAALATLGLQPFAAGLQKVDVTTLSMPWFVHPYPAVAPIYQPVQLNTGPRGITAALSKSAADAEPANSIVAPTKPSAFLIPPSHPRNETLARTTPASFITQPSR